MTAEQSPPCPCIASPDDIDLKAVERAFYSSSFSPWSRAELVQREYLEHVNGLYAEMWKLCRSDAQRELLAARIEEHRRECLSRAMSCLASLSVVTSVAIAGPSKFNGKQASSRGRSLDTKLGAFEAWKSSAREAIRSAILAARTDNERAYDEWLAFRTELYRELIIIIRSDKGIAPWEDHDRRLAMNAIVKLIKREEKRGRSDLVRLALEWLGKNNEWGPEPAFPEKHRIWKLGTPTQATKESTCNSSAYTASASTAASTGGICTSAASSIAAGARCSPTTRRCGA